MKNYLYTLKEKSKAHQKQIFEAKTIEIIRELGLAEILISDR